MNVFVLLFLPVKKSVVKWFTSSLVPCDMLTGCT